MAGGAAMSARTQLTADICIAQLAQDQAEAAQQKLIAHLDDLIAERTRIAETLACFYAAPLSISSVAPLLALAERMNPALAKRDKVLS